MRPCWCSYYLRLVRGIFSCHKKQMTCPELSYAKRAASLNVKLIKFRCMNHYASRIRFNVQLTLLHYLQHPSKVTEDADVCILCLLPTQKTKGDLYVQEEVLVRAELLQVHHTFIKPIRPHYTGSKI